MDQCNDISSTSGGGVTQAAATITGDVKKILDGAAAASAQVAAIMTAVKTEARGSGICRNRKGELCGIASCQNISDKLAFATSHTLAFYGFKNRMAIVKVCPSCVAKADEFQKKSIEAIKSGESLFSVKMEPQMGPETIDLDDEHEVANGAGHGSKEEVEVDFEREDLEDMVKKLLSKYDIKDQVEKCSQMAHKEADQLGREMVELNTMVEQVDNILYETYKGYNKAFERKPKPLVIQEIDINANGTIRRRNMPSDSDSNVFISSAAAAKLELAEEERRKAEERKLQDASVSQSKIASDAAAEFDALNDSIVSIPDETRKPGPASKTRYYEILEATRTGPFQRQIQRPPELQEKKTFSLLPTPSVIPRVKPKKDDIVYALNKSLLNYWLMGEVLDFVKNEDTDQTEFIVHYEPTKKGIPTGGVEGEGITRMMRQLTMRELAYNVPCPFILPVGTRIIAKFKDELNTDPGTDGHYYAGIVAEPPKPSSRNRYLIFFDDGYAQYVEPVHILLVCESSKEVWNDIHPDSHDFVKNYISRYPEWPLIRLFEGAIITTEWNGKWLVARVLEVDCSLAKVRFENDGREEWIYRGSPRFRPIYRRLEKEEENGQVPRHDPQQYKDQNAPVIEYKYDGQADNKKARKSTGRYQYYDLFAPNNHFNMMELDVWIEFQGSVTRIKIPDDAPKPKEFVPHTCDSKCVIEYVLTKELKTKSPLAIPLYLGWAREVTKSPRHAVFYRTPCGVRLRSYEELVQYLEVTQSNLSVDFFSFDIIVDCLNEFIPARAFVDLKDISYGKETRPIKCVNAVDYEQPAYMDYIPNRIAGKNVDLTTDENFLSCCDCTDNCQDKSKCACWQLTMQGIAFTKLNDENCPTKGYEYRRLNDHIVSGIYECNSKCHCKKTCFNRVVQNGVSWPLQIFKTTKKGWGIRALYDMPEGSFICIYAGQILTDQDANEEGREFGDEYLAELDYIECNEEVKADYESDVTDIEDEGSDEENSSRGGKRSKLGDEESEPEEDYHADDSTFVSNARVPENTRTFATRRTTGQKKNLDIINNDDDLITARAASHFNPKISPSKRNIKHRVKLRQLYGSEEQCYIMDAKSKGNIGRYLNHSCKPNVFVQNVFVDTHDLRFPMVAFFTNSFVKAGTELTWDYHYQIGSVPGKTMYCFCNSQYCRNRLL